MTEKEKFDELLHRIENLASTIKSIRAGDEEVTAFELETQCREIGGNIVLGAVESLIAGDQKQALKYITAFLRLVVQN